MRFVVTSPKTSHSRPIPCGIDLFAGAGGLSLGLAAAGFRVVAALDSDEDAVATLRANPGTAPQIVLKRDITRFGPKQMEDRIRSVSHRFRVDWIVGGPPCQGWSKVGRGKLRSLGRVSRNHDVMDDPRNRLYRSFVRYVAHFRPVTFVMENVRGMLSYYGVDASKEVETSFAGLGYDVSVTSLDASTIGVPQRRHRLTFVGTREDLGLAYRSPTTPPDDLGLDDRTTTVRDAIGDLPRVPVAHKRDPVPYPPPRERSRYLRLLRPSWMNGSVSSHLTRWHRADDIEAFRLLPQGGVYADLPERLKRYRDDIFLDRYHRLSWDDPSPCLTAHLSKDCYSHIHPSQGRTISVREAARLQGFPDWYRLEGPMGARYRLVGNSVPPIASYAIGRALRETLGWRSCSDWGSLSRRAAGAAS